MAGLEHYRMSVDPAIQKLSDANAKRHQYFRWTPRTALLNIVLMGIVPSILLGIAYKTDGKWNFRAKRKGDLLSEH
ncbi:hypothetical protein F4775DRAFT_554986 [Biscogniauxia sp. FL1348]|nr:hypothetical protein F4775DRAFT_554986 [Biscogniauxia sp. FL1348]